VSSPYRVGGADAGVDPDREGLNRPCRCRCARPDAYEARVGPRNGAQVIAKAWTDEGFAQWLREDATAAIASCGFGGLRGCHMVAVENTPTEHNVVMCTLCSRYPVAGARPAAGLAQIGTVPLAHGDGSFSESSAPRRTSAGRSSPNAHEDEMRSAPSFIHDTEPTSTTRQEKTFADSSDAIRRVSLDVI
jgi:hypothetical protein